VEDADAWRWHHSHNEEENPRAPRGARFRWRSGACCERGQRTRNEDACVEVPALIVNKKQDVAFYGVYDGHSGIDAVQRCQTELHSRVREKLRDDDDAKAALAAAFVEVDEAYCADAEDDRASLDAGATALACVLEVTDDGARLVVANCGDCAAVLSRTDSPVAVPLSKAHAAVPGSDEARRVVSAGGWITTETDLCVGRLHAMDLDDDEIFENAHERVRLNEIHRVCGEVAVTRAIGDVDFKGWSREPRNKRPSPCFVYPEDHPRSFVADLLVSTPDVVERNLDAFDDFVLVATDGLWDVLDPQEAVDAARTLFHKRRATPRDVAQQLVQRALRLGSGDNVTVVVLQFDAQSRTAGSASHAAVLDSGGGDHPEHQKQRRPPPPPREDDDDRDFDDDYTRRPVITASPTLLPSPSPPLYNGDDLSEMPFELSVQ